VHRYEFRVRYGDTDQMGFAYYGHYLRWFEIGRAELLRSQGRSYRDIEASGLRLPVLEAHCRYGQPARYDDLLAVDCAVLDLGRASVRFGYRIVRVDGETRLAHGWTEHCFLSPEGRPVRPSPDLARLLAAAPKVRIADLT
jgi:acyl-CoA thioester hydrolase